MIIILTFFLVLLWNMGREDVKASYKIDNPYQS